MTACPFTAKSSTRQFAEIPVTNGNQNEWRTTHFLPVCNLQPGETLLIHYENQVTTELDYNVDLSALIEARTWVGADPVTGTFYSGGTEPLIDGSTISDAHSSITGHNISRGTVHHQDYQRTWVFVAPKAIPTLYICGRARARSSGATPGAIISIDEGQGAIWYLRFPNGN